jgi:dolichol-phosphate mannosyltransferase
MNYKDLTIILPTLNEEETIETVINRLHNLYADVKIIVVDDGSRDFTEDKVNKLNKKYKNITFLNRFKEKRQKGLTASIIDGILLCKTKYAIVMDADMQHPPEKIKNIKEILDKGCKIVVATRASVKDWAFYRKFISKTLIILGYIVLFLRNNESCNDIFSGYFGVDITFASAIIKKNHSRFVGEGYKVLFDMLKCIKKGSMKICNVPYDFNKREAGESKAGARQFIALLKSFTS